MVRRGRPPKYTREFHEDICKSLEAGMSRTTAAELVGIDRGTLEDWRERYPAFSRDVQEAIAKAKARATVTITRAIQNGDVAASFRYLALQERSEWQEQRTADISIGISVDVKIRQLAQQLADTHGLNVEDVIQEATAIVEEARSGGAG